MTQKPFNLRSQNIKKISLSLSGILGSVLVATPLCAASDSATGSGWISFMPLLLMGLVLYFLMIRPQNKKMKEHKAMLADVNRGDRVVTNGGIIGTVHRVVNEEELQLEIADDVRVRVVRSMISTVMDKPQPLNMDGPTGPVKAQKNTPSKKMKKPNTPSDKTKRAAASSPRKKRALSA